MLPSGNDSAQSLAIYIGNYLLKKEQGSQNIDANIKEEDYPFEIEEENTEDYTAPE